MILKVPLIRKSPDDCTTKALKGLPGLTPGDFNVVGDRFAFRNERDLSHKAVITSVQEEARLKDCHAGVKNIGFLS